MSDNTLNQIPGSEGIKVPWNMANDIGFSKPPRAPVIVELPAPNIAELVAWFRATTDSERLSLLSALKCCRYCGNLNPNCQCENDE